MAITNAQQFKQLVNPPMKGKKRPGYRGPGGYQGGATNQGGAGGPGPGPGSGGASVDRSKVGPGSQFAKNVAKQNVDAMREGLRKSISPTFGNRARSGLTLALSAINPAFGLLSRMGKDFKSSRTLEEFRDKRRGYGRTMPSISNNPAFGGIETLGVYDDDEENEISPVTTDNPLSNAMFASAFTTPTEGKFGLNLTEYSRLKNNRYNDSQIQEAIKGGYVNDLLNTLALAEGGSINDQIRQAYGIGSIVKKAVGAVKKVAKSPVGKAALAFGAYKLSGGLKDTGFLKSKVLPFLVGTGGTPRPPTSGIFGAGGALTTGGALKAITAVSLLPLLGIGTGEETEEEAQAILQGQGLDIDAIRANPNQYLARAFKAEGGSMDEPVAKKTMPLLDMGGQEMDLRAEGGFVPIGRMEKADDVPARLSKNEFVFTAEAVRNAGEGDVDKGAEVMYNMMKNLEAGGDVSEESQGLEGARRMFQTSQRLEEVL